MSDYLKVLPNGWAVKHFLTAGRPGIWLLGGVNYVNTAYGPATSMHDIDGLFKIIEEIDRETAIIGWDGYNWWDTGLNAMGERAVEI